MLVDWRNEERKKAISDQARLELDRSWAYRLTIILAKLSTWFIGTLCIAGATAFVGACVGILFAIPFVILLGLVRAIQWLW